MLLLFYFIHIHTYPTTVLTVLTVRANPTTALTQVRSVRYYDTINMTLSIHCCCTLNTTVSHNDRNYYSKNCKALLAFLAAFDGTDQNKIQKETCTLPTLYDSAVRRVCCPTQTATYATLHSPGATIAEHNNTYVSPHRKRRCRSASTRGLGVPTLQGRRLTGAWCWSSGIHFSFTLWKLVGSTTLKHTRKTSCVSIGHSHKQEIGRNELVKRTEGHLSYY